MSTKRIRHTVKFKFTIAIEGDKNINQLASEHQLHPSQISQWKKQLLDTGSQIFSNAVAKHQLKQYQKESDLYLDLRISARRRSERIL